MRPNRLYNIALSIITVTVIVGCSDEVVDGGIECCRYEGHENCTEIAVDTAFSNNGMFGLVCICEEDGYWQSLGPLMGDTIGTWESFKQILGSQSGGQWVCD